VERAASRHGTSDYQRESERLYLDKIRNIGYGVRSVGIDPRWAGSRARGGTPRLFENRPDHNPTRESKPGYFRARNPLKKLNSKK
jgi:hypothetical protein